MSEREVNDLVMQKNYSKALDLSLSNPPFTGTEDDKKKSASVVHNVLQASYADSTKLVEALSNEQRDTLMKYIYKALETGTNTQSLLAYHKSLSDVGGTGVIVRALVDRNNIL
jgi:actin related protein 2/3 complex subunit 5